MILLISNKWDISVDFIIQELRKRKVDFIRLNTEDLPFSDCSITIPNKSFLITVNKKTYELENNLKSVLFRRPGKPLEKTEIKIPIDDAAIKYVREQWQTFIEGILGIDEVLWINHPRANDLMECKIIQLRKANEVGFKIPKTCITSSKGRGEKFIEHCGGQIVVKSLYSSLIEYPEKDYFIFTNVIDSLKDVSELEIGITPVILQEFINEKIDYRITVIGKKIYAARIETTNGDRVPVDWRTCKSGLKFIPCELPENIKEKCITFVSECGLIFGTIDLVHAGDDFYFLEINPNGEWGWLQKSAGLPIAESITDYLVNGINIMR